MNESAPTKRFVFFFLLLMGMYHASAQLRVTQLRVEHMSHPSVLDVAHPRFSWINVPVSADARSERQTAWQIQVSTSREALLQGECDTWDSGKRKGSESSLVSYEGTELTSGQDYWYRIRVWNKKGHVSAWSEPSHWSMGILDAHEWKAQWIASDVDKMAPLFRKAFSIDKVVKRAKVFISGLGYFELYTNGHRIGNDFLVPNFTNYTERPHLKNCGIALDGNFRNHRVLYLSYDITSYLQRGKNVIGVVLGNGFYDCTYTWVARFGKPCLICQMHIDYEDGSKAVITSDTTWQTASSPLIKNGPYIGEVYDAHKEITDWSTPHCKDGIWTNAQVATAPSGKLTAQSSPSDKITETLPPLSLTQRPDGSYEVDFGKEISGWVRMKGITGKDGDTLDVKYLCESPLGVHRYIFKDSLPVNYAPRFTWYVFSKAIISGLDHLEKSQIQAEAVNTDVPICSQFSCSNSLINTIHEIWQRSQLDNMHGCIASDCPHRERSPYTGDGQAACAMVMYDFDAAAFYQKWIRDIHDVQDTLSGYVPNGAPWQPGCGGGVAWGAAMNIMPWEFYLHYGDRTMLENNYEAMCMQVAYMKKWLTPEGTMLQQKSNPNSSTPNTWLNLGDWSPAFGFPSTELVHTFYLWLSMDCTSRAADILGKKDEAISYRKQADDVKNAFHKKFYNNLTHSYGDYGSNIYALRMGVPQDVYTQVVQALREEITIKYNNHINTGFLAARYFFEVLADNGMADIAVKVLNQTDFPSFGYWIQQGATVTWEQWDGKNSRNHPMFGGSLVWLYSHLAGIRLDEQQPAFKHFDINPVFVPSISRVSSTIRSPYGIVRSQIQQHADTITYEMEVPVGCVATVHFPTSNISFITESGRSLKKSKGVTYRKPKQNGNVTADVQQGKYIFSIINGKIK